MRVWSAPTAAPESTARKRSQRCGFPPAHHALPKRYHATKCAALSEDGYAAAVTAGERRIALSRRTIACARSREISASPTPLIARRYPEPNAPAIARAISEFELPADRKSGAHARLDAMHMKA
jgi:hypothetical protein